MICPPRIPLLALFAGIALSSCGTTSNAVHLEKKDAGRRITLSQGGELVVVLQGNISTGFQWEVASIDKGVLRQSARPAFEAYSDADGSGGDFTMRFQGVAPGETTLKLIYRRPFEPDEPPIENYQVTVRVE